MSQKINRVDQLDAAIIDTEAKQILMRQLVNCFPQGIVSRYSAEITLLLDYLFFRFTVSKGVVTPGNTLQNLDYKFKQGNKQRLFLMIFTVFLPYVVTKIGEHMSRENWNDPRVYRNKPTIV